MYKYIWKNLRIFNFKRTVIKFFLKNCEGKICTYLNAASCKFFTMYTRSFDNIKDKISTLSLILHNWFSYNF